MRVECGSNNYTDGMSNNNFLMPFIYISPEGTRYASEHFDIVERDIITLGGMNEN